MNQHKLAARSSINLWQYCLNLWLLPLVFFCTQFVIRISENPILANTSIWVSVTDMAVFIAFFLFAAYWSHRPVHKAIHQQTQDYEERLEQAMAELPWRAIKSFFLAGLAYVLYLMIVIAIVFNTSNHTLTASMVIALSLCIGFGLAALAPSLGVALTLAWMAKVRKQLSQQQLFIGNLEQFHSYHWIIRSANRPWLIFAVTSLLPVSILASFTWLMLGTTDESEQSFILMQAIVLFFSLIAGGTSLVWVTSRTMQRITHELATGLDFLRQGKFDGRVAVMIDNDMGDLARGLNTALLGLKERDSLKDALAIASDIQRGLMPRSQPSIAGYSIAGFQQSCYSVGGDYYDYIQRNNETTWLVIADVAGKGYPAALTVANLQAMLHALANTPNITLLDAITYANQALHQSLQGGRFVTLFMAELNPASHTLSWVNAGHIPPLLWQNNQLSRLEATSPPLGILEGIGLQEQQLELAVGDVLFNCTDGVTEARHASSQELFGDHRTEAWFREHYHLNPSDMSASILNTLHSTGFDSFDDDITLLCLKRSNHDQY